MPPLVAVLAVHSKRTALEKMTSYRWGHRSSIRAWARSSTSWSAWITALLQGEGISARPISVQVVLTRSTCRWVWALGR